jgi:hypothetical protein
MGTGSAESPFYYAFTTKESLLTIVKQIRSQTFVLEAKDDTHHTN